MFGIDVNAVKSCFQGFQENVARLEPSNDPTVRTMVAFILALGKAFGVK